MSKPVTVGIVGCGAISAIYCKNLTETFSNVTVKTLADLDVARAQARAEEFGIPGASTVDELMADPEIQIVVNLTVPKAHYPVAMQAVEAGKSVIGEKPFTVTREEGRKLLAAAKAKGVLVGSAPDTFFGAGIQTARKLIDDGFIGKPVSCTAFMQCHGHETWHPSPEFYYEVGGGPMFDMGPYYLTALVNLLGPVARVTGSASKAYETRTITSMPKKGKVIPVETPTHLAGVLDFATGCVGTIITSFDVFSAGLPNIQIHGTEGSLGVPDPNGFGGPVRLYRPEDGEWRDMPLTHRYKENSRGIGVADMAAALQSGRAHRANGELAFHVLDIMHAFEESSTGGVHITLESSCSRPAAMPTTLVHGSLD